MGETGACLCDVVAKDARYFDVEEAGAWLCDEIERDARLCAVGETTAWLSDVIVRELTVMRRRGDGCMVM